MQLELPTPKIFIAEGIEAEDLLTFRDQIRGCTGFGLHVNCSKQGQNQQGHSSIDQCFMESSMD
jgi:hypothetical protein